MSVNIQSVETLPVAQPAREATAADVPQPYSNPYVAGVGLGMVLLAAFVIMGRGLGASGAFNAFAAWIAAGIAPSWLRSHEFLAQYADGTTNPLKTWLVFEVVGVFTGAMISGVLARRFLIGIERGPRVGVSGRLALAFAGGVVSAIGAALARGCTSGQALTGGALLNLGSWAFMLSVFAGGYGMAYFVRREWR
jgi:uncharacterized protein